MAAPITTEDLAWERMKQIEPELAKLEADAVEADKNLPDIRNKRIRAWNKGFKQRTRRLVGYGARNPQLTNFDIYGLACERLTRVLGL